MNKKIEILLIAGLAVLLLFGCTQTPLQNNTANNNSTGNVVAPANGADQVVNQANTSTIPDTSGVNTGDMVDLNQ